jgi:cytochrome c
MKYLPSSLLAFALAAGALAPAHANKDLALKRACLACHSVDAKVLGPAYKDVAKRYAGQNGIEAKLIDKVLKGGKGAWGDIAMPANDKVSPAEAKQLVQWILSLK